MNEVQSERGVTIKDSSSFRRPMSDIAAIIENQGAKERSALQPDPRPVTMQEAADAYQRQNTVTVDRGKTQGGE